jgi:septal ring factor EnvC (AmiA/AmiB activator)
MEPQQLISIFLTLMTLIAACFAYLWNRSEKGRDDLISKHSKQIDQITADLADHKLHVAQSYVTQSELARAVENFHRSVDKLMTAIQEMSRDHKEAFAELHRRIDGKADK